jgi:hypothetical protein
MEISCGVFTPLIIDTLEYALNGLCTRKSDSKSVPNPHRLIVYVRQSNVNRVWATICNCLWGRHYSLTSFSVKQFSEETVVERLFSGLWSRGCYQNDTNTVHANRFVANNKQLIAFKMLHAETQFNFRNKNTCMFFQSATSRSSWRLPCVKNNGMQKTGYNSIYFLQLITTATSFGTWSFDVAMVWNGFTD